jgi:hypothetical protein
MAAPAEVAFARVPSFAYSIARLRVIVFTPLRDHRNRCIYAGDWLTTI